MGHEVEVWEACAVEYVGLQLVRIRNSTFAQSGGIEGSRGRCLDKGI